jgi:hypothetical protein
MVNPNNTLTVEFLLKALADGRITKDQPLGVIVGGETRILGVNSFELHTYESGEKVLMICTETQSRPVAYDPGISAAEVGF